MALPSLTSNQGARAGEWLIDVNNDSEACLVTEPRKPPF